MFDLLVLTKLTGNPQQRGKLCKLDLLGLTGSGDTINNMDLQINGNP